MSKILPIILIILFSLNSQALFEVKDASNHSVFEIFDNGIRILSFPDTLMIISSDEIRANLDNSQDKALSRSFSVSTTTTAKEGRADVLEVSTVATKMREGGAGDEYTDFSPQNIFLGLHAGRSTSGTSNVFLGNDAGFSNTSGGANVFIGHEAGYSNQGMSSNTYVGHWAGRSSTGNMNAFFGYAAGTSNIGNQNSYFGQNAGSMSDNASDNCFFGYSAGVQCDGSNNVMIGSRSGYFNQAGTGNVFLGYNSGENETGSNRLYIDNSDTTDPLIFGEFDNNRVVINGNSGDNPSNYTFYVNGRGGGDYSWNSLSDKRLKKNILTIDNPLDIVTNLRGVFYEWKDPETQEKGRRIGFIAQEASKILPEVVDDSGEYFSMQYAPITAVLVEAVKKQQIAIEELKKENDILKKEIEEIKRKLEK